MNYYLKAFNNYAVFSGRARRKEYWFFVLFNMIFAFVSAFVDTMIGTYMTVYLIYVLVAFIPGLAVAVRRLHDVGKSGWMILISLIPVIGAIWLLVLLVTDSEPGKNQYGESPKNTTIA